ncbi:hypothetical protein AGR56_17820 [Clostridium sp. DMHC 10]|nr:hypothetical protein AGR56_17820 [Clostridium sp. DMHC 10]
MYKKFIEMAEEYITIDSFIEDLSLFSKQKSFKVIWFLQSSNLLIYSSQVTLSNFFDIVILPLIFIFLNFING